MSRKADLHSVMRNPKYQKVVTFETAQAESIELFKRGYFNLRREMFQDFKEQICAEDDNVVVGRIFDLLIDNLENIHSVSEEEFAALRNNMKALASAGEIPFNASQVMMGDSRYCAGLQVTTLMMHITGTIMMKGVEGAFAEFSKIVQAENAELAAKQALQSIMAMR